MTGSDSQGQGGNEALQSNSMLFQTMSQQFERNSNTDFNLISEFQTRYKVNAVEKKRLHYSLTEEKGAVQQMK